MIVFPNCKINLGLNILRKRPDGFHDLETLFYPIKWNDCLEIISSKEATTLTVSGLTVDGDPSNNLCLKAYHLLKKDIPELPAVNIHLHKAIPMGAGLGGGSSDGAFMLKLLNDKYGLELSKEQLLAYAAELGSDGPFFVINKPCLASGRGEILEETDADLSGYEIVLVNPGIHINTGAAFTELTPSVPAKKISEIIRQDIHTWKDELVNDFEKPVFDQHPSIKEIKENLYANGAIYAAMSGSGSTVFGIFSKGAVPSFGFPADHLLKIA